MIAEELATVRRSFLEKIKDTDGPPRSLSRDKTRDRPAEESGGQNTPITRAFGSRSCHLDPDVIRDDAEDAEDHAEKRFPGSPARLSPLFLHSLPPSLHLREVSDQSPSSSS